MIFFAEAKSQPSQNFLYVYSSGMHGFVRSTPEFLSVFDRFSVISRPILCILGLLNCGLWANFVCLGAFLK